MTSAFPPRPPRSEWRSLYRAAILETNHNVISERLSRAESAVLARGREIFYGDASSEEREDLEEALYALRAFRTALEHSEAA